MKRKRTNQTISDYSAKKVIQRSKDLRDVQTALDNCRNDKRSFLLLSLGKCHNQTLNLKIRTYLMKFLKKERSLCLDFLTNGLEK